MYVSSPGERQQEGPGLTVHAVVATSCVHIFATGRGGGQEGRGDLLIDWLARWGGAQEEGGEVDVPVRNDLACAAVLVLGHCHTAVVGYVEIVIVLAGGAGGGGGDAVGVEGSLVGLATAPEGRKM